MGKAYCWWMAYAKSMGSMYTGNRFRTVDLGPDWTFGDKWNLDEYTALGGKADINCADIAVVGVKSEMNLRKEITVQSFSTKGLAFNLPEAGLTNISIFNSSGKVRLQEKDFSGKAGLNQFTFSQKLNVGLHFVQINSGNGMTMKVKLINNLK